jgi:hypothetical protein
MIEEFLMVCVPDESRLPLFDLRRTTYAQSPNLLDPTNPRMKLLPGKSEPEKPTPKSTLKAGRAPAKLTAVRRKSRPAPE